MFTFKPYIHVIIMTIASLIEFIKASNTLMFYQDIIIETSNIQINLEAKFIIYITMSLV